MGCIQTRYVVNMGLIVGGGDTSLDFGIHIGRDSIEILVHPVRTVVGKLMNVLPMGWQGGEGKQKPDGTDDMTQAVSGVFAERYLNHDVLLVRTIENSSRGRPRRPPS